MRVAIRVQPRSRRTRVGGVRGDALLVRVAAPPEDGRATEAALGALATALGSHRRDVRLLAGATARDKIVDVMGESRALRERVDALRQRAA